MCSRTTPDETDSFSTARRTGQRSRQRVRVVRRLCGVVHADFRLHVHKPGVESTMVPQRCTTVFRSILLVISELSLARGWVLYSPVDRRNSPNNFLAYENGANTPWSGPDAFKLDTVAMRWSLPPRVHSDEGLGGGISFALHKDFCSRMIDVFPEKGYEARLFGDFFLNCGDLRNAVKRAMETWAINHKNINFQDVTEECAHWDGSDGLTACPHAELFIVPEDVQSSHQGDLAAWVTHNLTEASINRAPFTTAGFQLPYDPNRAGAWGQPGGIGVTQAKLTMRAPTSSKTFCWYLDASFCSLFHYWEEKWNFVIIGRLVCGILFGISFIIMLWVVFSIVYAVCCEEANTVDNEPGNLARGSSVIGFDDRASSLPRGMSIPHGGCSAPPSPPPSPPPRDGSCVSVSIHSHVGPGTPRTEQALRSMAARPEPSKSVLGRRANLGKSVGSKEADISCGSRRCTNLLDYLAVMPTGMLLLSLFWLIFCPAFYFRVFLPCWDCYDFESTVAHEIGHVLGFHHPDQLWELNLNSNRSMASCATPAVYEHLVAQESQCDPSPFVVGGAPSPPPPPPPWGPSTCCFPYAMDYVYLNQTQDIKASIMFSTTTHRSRTCLSADDLEGLNFLYPVCSGAEYLNADQTEPLCIKAKQLSGWLRLLYITFIPFLIVTTLIFIVQMYVRRHQEKRMRSLKAAGERLRDQRAQLLHKIKLNTTNKVAKQASTIYRQGTAHGLTPRLSRGRSSSLGRSTSISEEDRPRGGPRHGPTHREQELEAQVQRCNRQLAQIDEQNMATALAASAAQASAEADVGSRACCAALTQQSAAPPRRTSQEGGSQPTSGDIADPASVRRRCSSGHV